MNKATGLDIPRGEEGRGVECVLDVPVRGLQGQSFQSWLVRLPVRERGMGLRSLVDTIPAAFIGSVEMSLPFFTGEEGICRILEPVIGDIQSENAGRRWGQLINSDCRTGREFSECWEMLQGEARECSVYLGEELEDELAKPVSAAGDGRVDGKTRALVTQQRERLRARVLYKALSDHPDQTARPVWAFPQFDKMSCSWLLATPSPDTYMSGPVFREAMATHLCLPSPCCRSHVGKPTGYRGELVDAFGDNVMSATLPFDTWRTRHNDIQRGIVARANEARVEVEAEVFGLFRDIIPAAVMAEGGGLETVRDRMGCVPDLRIGFPVPLSDRRPDYYPRLGRPPVAGQAAAQPAPQPPAHPVQGPPTRYLAELKVMGAGSSRYPRAEAGSSNKQVDRRARGLPADYKRKLAAIDSQYYHTAVGATGPLVQRLESMGELLCLVVGAFGEVSEDLERTIKAIAESRALYLSRESGQPVSEARAGWILGQYRRLLSCLFIRSQASCLLARMGHLGEGAKECAARRRVAMAEEERMRKEGEAFFSAHIRGRGRWRGN